MPDASYVGFKGTEIKLFAAESKERDAVKNDRELLVSSKGRYGLADSVKYSAHWVE